MKPRIAVVDDHTLLTDALEHLLVPDCEVVGKFSDPRAFLARVEQIKPDVAILDVTMPSLNGLDTAREVRRLVPSVRIIMLTMNEDPDVAAEAFRIGVSGYLLKRSAGSELATAVREVMSHHSYVTPFLTQHLVGALIQNPQTRKRIHGLTARQREVLQLLAEGRSMKEVATVLDLSVRTVAFHKYKMMEHLHIDSTAALIQFAVREGIV
jgi:DNA-binding NarL/FixJ family response regulator